MTLNKPETSKKFNFQIINALLKTITTGRVGYEEGQVISEGLTIFENELSNRPSSFFGGAKPGMLDYMIWPWCERSDALKMFGRNNLLRKDKYKKLVKPLFM